MSLKKYIICSFFVQSALCGIECALLLLSYFQLERFHSSCQLRVEVSHRCVCQRLLWSILHLPCQEVCCAVNDRHGWTSWTSEDIAICASQSHHNHITITSQSPHNHITLTCCLADLIIRCDERVWSPESLWTVQQHAWQYSLSCNGNNEMHKLSEASTTQSFRLHNRCEVGKFFGDPQGESKEKFNYRIPGAGGSQCGHDEC